MCDAEELDFEDFQLMLAAISRMSPPSKVVLTEAVSQRVVSKRRK